MSEKLCIEVETGKIALALNQIRTAKDSIVKVATEMNDVIHFVAEASADGIITNNEYIKILKEINDALAVLSALKAKVLKGTIQDCLFINCCGTI